MSAVATDISKLISDAEITDVHSGIIARRGFRLASYIFEVLSELCNCTSIVLLAIAIPLDNKLLNYWGLGLSVTARSLTLLKTYCLRESRNRTLEINIITKKLGIGELPDIVLDEEILSSRILRQRRKGSESETADKPSEIRVSIPTNQPIEPLPPTTPVIRPKPGSHMV